MTSKRGKSHMEEKQQSFNDRLKELLTLAKNKKGVLDYQEINDFFADMELDANRFDKIIDYLERNGVDVFKVPDIEDIDDAEIVLDDEEADLSKIDLSVPEGVSIEDPVRMYLKEIGKVPLLSRKRRSSWPSGWKRATEKLKRSFQRQTCVSS